MRDCGRRTKTLNNLFSGKVTSLTNKMEMVWKCGLMGAIITETSKKGKSMGLGFTIGLMGPVIQGTGLTMKCRDQVHLNGWTVGVSMVGSRTV